MFHMTKGGWKLINFKYIQRYLFTHLRNLFQEKLDEHEELLKNKDGVEISGQNHFGELNIGEIGITRDHQSF